MNRIPRSRALTRAPIFVGLAALFMILCVATSHAHSFVRSTHPKDGSNLRKPPSVVSIRFNESVELAFGGIQVFDPSGRRVDRGNTEYVARDRKVIRTQLEADLANGTYVVRWRIVAADGHPRRGQFDFRLAQSPPPSLTPGSDAEEPREEERGTAAPGADMGDEGGMWTGVLPNTLLGITRWAIFAGLLLLVGLGGFALLVWRRTGGLSRSPWVNRVFYRRSAVLMRVALGVAIVGSLASIPVQGAIAADVRLRQAFSGDILRAVFDTRFGELVLVRSGLLLVFAAVLLPWRTVAERQIFAAATARQDLGAAAVRPAEPRIAVGLFALLGVAVLATVSFGGHAGTTEPVPLNMTADVLHLAGAAVWLGGLVGLVAVALPATRSLEEGERVRVAAPVVSRFSDLAFIAVAVIALSGAFRAWIEIRTLEGLTGYAYGLTLLGKLAVVVPLLALGAINRQWTKPRLTRAAAAGDASPGSAPLRTLRRLVLIEVVLAAVVLAVTAALVELPPPTAGPGGEHT
ncbi:MAG: CopD family protein [Actinomycetota bacterium]|nr:CopD family protein [Actinomycetota bacterium]